MVSCDRISQAILSLSMVTQTSAVSEEFWKEIDWKRGGRSLGLAPAGTGMKSSSTTWKAHTGQ